MYVCVRNPGKFYLREFRQKISFIIFVELFIFDIDSCQDIKKYTKNI